MTFSSIPITPTELQNELQRIEQETRTLLRVSTSKANVAQTPKEVVWTLNKAKLYHYIPVVPAEQRHKVPLFLVFALMNRPSILDLRPGNSFIEYMVKHGYDVYLLDWGAPGPEDKDLKFDDYVLDYLPRAIRKLKAVLGSDEFSMLGWCIGAIPTTIYAALKVFVLQSIDVDTTHHDMRDKVNTHRSLWIVRCKRKIRRLLMQ